MKRIITIIAIIICGMANAQTGYLVQPAKWKFIRPQWLDSGLWIKNIPKYGGQNRVLVYDSITNKVGYKYISNGSTYTAGRGLTLNSNVFRLDTTKAYTWTANNTFSTSVTTPSLIGSTSSGGTLTLNSTSHGTKGKILFGTSAYDEVNNRLGIGTTTPTKTIDINGDYRFGNGGGDATVFANGTGAIINMASIDRVRFAYSGASLYIQNANSGGLYFSGNSGAEIGGDVGFKMAGNFTIGTLSSISKLAVPIAPTASANYGLVSLGSGAFDGSTSGFFTGSANGTLIAGNLASGSTSDFINLEKGGVGKFKVDNKGNETTKNGITSGTLFTQTATATVANTTTETTLVSTGTGSVTLPADFFEVGKSIVIHGEGIHSAAGNPNITIKIKIGGTTYLTTGAVVSGNSTDAYIEIKGTLTCRTTGSSGTLMAQGFYTNIETGGGDNHFGMANTTTQTINTTTANAIDVTVQWGTASVNNTLSLTNLTIEAKN